MSQSPEELLRVAVQAVENKKGEDITILDLRDISIITDFFMICTGRSSTQVKAIVEYIEDKLKEKGIFPLRKEGMSEGKWVLMDYGDVIIHVFQEAERYFYNLERLWGDARIVNATSINFH